MSRHWALASLRACTIFGVKLPDYAGAQCLLQWSYHQGPKLYYYVWIGYDDNGVAQYRVVSYTNLAQYGLMWFMPVEWFGEPVVTDYQTLSVMQEWSSAGLLEPTRTAAWIEKAMPWWTLECGANPLKWWREVLSAEPVADDYPSHSGLTRALRMVVDPSASLDEAVQRLSGACPFALPDEKTSMCFNHRAFIKAVRATSGVGRQYDAALDVLFHIAERMHSDQGLYQLEFYYFSVLLSPAYERLAALYREVKVRAMTRKQLMSRLKEWHVAIKRSTLPSAGGLRMSDAETCGMMYLHFVAGRGWSADQDEERRNRSRVWHPLTAITTIGTASEGEYRRIDATAKRDMLELMAAHLPNIPLRTIEQDFKNRLIEAPQGSAAGETIILQPAWPKPTILNKLRQQVEELGGATDLIWTKIMASLRARKSTVDVLLVYQGSTRRAVSSVIRCLRQETVAQPKVRAAVETLMYARWRGSAEVSISNQPESAGIHITARKMNRWCRRLAQKRYKQLVGDIITEKLARVQWLRQAYRRAVATVRRQRVQVNKKVWLEGLNFSDVHKFLQGEPILRGTGFQKGELAVARQLIAAEPMHTYVSRYFLKNIDTLYRWHPWCDLGYNAEEEHCRRVMLCGAMRRSQPAGCALGLDFQDFNACHPLDVMANDYLTMVEVFTNAYQARGEDYEAIMDWRRVGKWLSKAALNPQVRFEDRKEWFRVAVGMFSGIQDTNGTNERMQVTEATRALIELKRCGIELQPGQAPFIRLLLRGDDSIAIFEDMLSAAMYMGTFCGSGRPMGVSKQEISANGCEYLRCRVSGCSVRGYVLRSLGTLLSSPFENTDKRDLTGRCSALLAQFQVILRRGGNAQAVRELVRVAIDHWSSFGGGEAFQLGTIRIPAGYQTTTETSGGWGTVLWPCELQYCSQMPHLPTLRVTPVRAAQAVKRRGTTDLIWGRLDESGLPIDVRTSVAERAIARAHIDMCSGASTASEVTMAYQQYMKELVTVCGRQYVGRPEPTVALWADSRGSVRAHLIPLLWLTTIGDVVKRRVTLPEVTVHKMAAVKAVELIHELLRVFTSSGHVSRSRVVVIDTTVSVWQSLAQTWRLAGGNVAVLVAPPRDRRDSLSRIRGCPRENQYYRSDDADDDVLARERDDLEGVRIAKSLSLGLAYDVNVLERLGCAIGLAPITSRIDKIQTCVSFVVKQFSVAVASEGRVVHKPLWAKPVGDTPMWDMRMAEEVAQTLGCEASQVLIDMIKTQMRAKPTASGMRVLSLAARCGREIIHELETLKYRAPKCCASLVGPLVTSTVRKLVLNWLIIESFVVGRSVFKEYREEAYSAMILSCLALCCDGYTVHVTMC